MQMFLRYLFLTLFGLFCFAYPFAVVGVAFDVKPPFSLAWAGSTLLFLEGTLLIVGAMLRYKRWRGLSAGLCIIVLSYAVETLGVTTGVPFGTYRYTGVLFPALPGSVPFAVMFAWILVVLGSYGTVMRRRNVADRRTSPGSLLLAAALAMLLDLAIEPVAAYIEHYWQWLSSDSLNYYGVPLANFASWFVVAFVLLLVVNWLFTGGDVSERMAREEMEQKYAKTRSMFWPLVVLAPRLLFACSLFMFGLVDLTHGYYWAALLALLAGAIVYIRWK